VIIVILFKVSSFTILLISSRFLTFPRLFIRRMHKYLFHALDPGAKGQFNKISLHRAMSWIEEYIYVVSGSDNPKFDNITFILIVLVNYSSNILL
jgi:hypothetical protein